MKKITEYQLYNDCYDTPDTEIEEQTEVDNGVIALCIGLLYGILVGVIFTVIYYEIG